MADRTLERVSRIPGVSTAEMGLLDDGRVVVSSLGPANRTRRLLALDDPAPICRFIAAGVGSVETGDSGVTVPIRTGGTLIGALTARFAEGGGHEVGWLEDAAESAALAIENEALRARSDAAVREVVTVLAAMIEGRDAYTESHCVHMAEGALGVGLRLGLQGEALERLTFGGLLHDIGKIAVPDRILTKPGPLSDDEYTEMQAHASRGQEIISTIGHLADVAPVVGQHHERFDGSGYPKGLAGSEIVLEARILGVIDTFDAMTSTRPYRAALPWKTATEEILRGSGTLFDPDVVGAFFGYVRGEEAQWVDSSPT